jgi:dipeptidase
VCYVTHSDDGHIEADSSVIYVPRAAFDPKGSRPVYPSAVATEEMPEWNCFLSPRLQKDDGPAAYRHPDLPRTTAIGQVPYADILGFLGDTGRNYTYAYLDANYGISNEWGLMFGECTNGAKVTLDKPIPNKRIFYSSELARVALEHCKTARDAVRLIGHLIDTYGYWGTGETLPVADGTEGWVIEMAPIPDGYTKAGGLWVAKRVPDGEFFVAANEFRIRELDPAERDKTVMYGDNLYAVAKDLGWYTEDKPGSGIIDWLPTVSLGEYSHPYYSLRRVWRALSLAAPSLGLNPWIQDGKGGVRVADIAAGVVRAKPAVWVAPGACRHAVCHVKFGTFVVVAVQGCQEVARNRLVRFDAERIIAGKAALAVLNPGIKAKRRRRERKCAPDTPQ